VIRWWRAAAATVACAAALAAWPTSAEAARFAIVIASDRGQSHEVTLRYAERDAERLGRVLARLGGFTDDTTLLLRGASVKDVRRTLAEVGRRLGTTPGEHLVFLYYSGHADGESLHLGAETLPLAELKAAVVGLPAAVRIVVIDACQSGALTRVKGGRPGPSFAVDEAANASRGLAILASSSESELAQESDDIGGSFFTHYFILGLTGAADVNRDGRVSLAESFEFSSRRTLAATVATAVGPQHPTFRFDLVGEQDVVLTRPATPSAGFGRLTLDRPGRYFVRRRGAPFVTEIVSGGVVEVALEPGQYEVASRLDDRLEVAEADIQGDSAAAALSQLRVRQVGFGQVVRKGGGVRQRAYSIAALGGARTAVASLGSAMTAGLVARLDGELGSLELRAGFGRSTLDGPMLTTTTSDVFAALAGLRAVDLRHVTLAAGLEAGWTGFEQRFGGTTRGGLSHAVSAGPTAVLEVPFGPRFCLRVDATLPVYLLREQTEGGDTLRVRPAARLWAGAGVYF
jgi:hypothetical protein